MLTASGQGEGASEMRSLILTLLRFPLRDEALLLELLRMALVVVVLEVEAGEVAPLAAITGELALVFSSHTSPSLTCPLLKSSPMLAALRREDVNVLEDPLVPAPPCSVLLLLPLLLWRDIG